jgi:hypothetical protein
LLKQKHLLKQKQAFAWFCLSKTKAELSMQKQQQAFAWFCLSKTKAELSMQKQSQQLLSVYEPAVLLRSACKNQRLLRLFVFACFCCFCLSKNSRSKQKQLLLLLKQNQALDTVLQFVIF